MRRLFVLSALAAASVLISEAAAFARDFKNFEPGKEYAWIAEVVSVDQAAGTLTARARLRYGVNSEYEQFTPGEQIALQWYSPAWGDTDGIQELGPKDKINGMGFYVMPVEFVSLDRISKTVTFKTPIKGDALRMANDLSAKESIKVISPYWPNEESSPILSVEAYNSASTPHSSN